MQAINRLLSQNCNCYPHLFRCSTIKIHNFSSMFPWKTSLLPCFHHISIHCSVFKVQLLFQSNCCFAFAKLQSLIWVFQLDHWEIDYMSRYARHWIVLSLWSQISKSSFLGFEIQQQIGLVGPSGLEPPTLRLSVVRSSQLSYGPLFSLVEIVGIEPATSCLQGRRSPSWAISPSYLRFAGIAYTL